jgi:hypothetical protein
MFAIRLGCKEVETKFLKQIMQPRRHLLKQEQTANFNKLHASKA